MASSPGASSPGRRAATPAGSGGPGRPDSWRRRCSSMFPAERRWGSPSTASPAVRTGSRSARRVWGSWQETSLLFLHRQSGQLHLFPELVLVFLVGVDLDGGVPGVEMAIHTVVVGEVSCRAQEDPPHVHQLAEGKPGQKRENVAQVNSENR